MHNAHAHKHSSIQTQIHTHTHQHGRNQNIEYMNSIEAFCERFVFLGMRDYDIFISLV